MLVYLHMCTTCFASHVASEENAGPEARVIYGGYVWESTDGGRGVEMLESGNGR